MSQSEIINKLNSFIDAVGYSYNPKVKSLVRGRGNLKVKSATVSAKVEETILPAIQESRPDTSIYQVMDYFERAFTQNWQELNKVSVSGFESLIFECEADVFDSILEKRGGYVTECGVLEGCKLSLIKAEYNRVYNRFSSLPQEVKKEISHQTCLFPKSEFNDFFEEYIENRIEAHRDAVRARLAFEADEAEYGLEQIDRLVRVLTPADAHEDVFQLNRAAIIHLIHQVKTKLAGGKVDYHMMPYLVSFQGAGKTELVKKLGAPLGGFFTIQKLREVISSFSERMAESHYLMCLDEFEAEDKDLPMIKQIITPDYNKARAMYSQTLVKYKANASFIATSNTPLKHAAGDFTGMRRFWEINCNPVGADPMILETCQLDFEEINRLDYLAMWKAVDERKPSIIHEYISKMRPVQDSYRKRNRAEQWLELWGYLPVGQDCKDYSVLEVFEEYRDYAADNELKNALGFSEFHKLVELTPGAKFADPNKTRIRLNAKPVNRFEEADSSEPDLRLVDFS